MHSEGNLFYDAFLAVASNDAGGEDSVVASRVGVVAAGTRALLRIHAVVIKVVAVARPASGLVAADKLGEWT